MSEADQADTGVGEPHQPRPRVPVVVTYHCDGDYREDLVLKDLAVDGFSDAERGSRRAWRLYKGLAIRLEADTEGIVLGSLPTGHWAAVLDYGERFAFVVEQGAQVRRKYGILNAPIISAKDQVAALKHAGFYPEFSTDHWKRFEEWARNFDEQCEAEERQREKRWAEADL